MSRQVSSGGIRSTRPPEGGTPTADFGRQALVGVPPSGGIGSAGPPEGGTPTTSHYGLQGPGSSGQRSDEGRRPEPPPTGGPSCPVVRDGFGCRSDPVVTVASRIVFKRRCSNDKV